MILLTVHKVTPKLKFDMEQVIDFNVNLSIAFNVCVSYVISHFYTSSKTLVREPAISAVQRLICSHTICLPPHRLVMLGVKGSGKGKTPWSDYTFLGVLPLVVLSITSKCEQ